MISKEINSKRDLEEYLKKLGFEYYQFNYTFNTISNHYNDCYRFIDNKRKYEIGFLDTKQNLEPIVLYYYTKNKEGVYDYNNRLYGYDAVIEFLNNNFKNQLRKMIIKMILNVK